eukprot:5803515-Pleurochrysis_carterae.AAC.2
MLRELCARVCKWQIRGSKRCACACTRACGKHMTPSDVRACVRELSSSRERRATMPRSSKINFGGSAPSAPWNPKTDRRESMC